MKIPAYDDYDQFLDGTPVTEIEADVKEEDVEKLFFLKMPDDSMEPTIKAGEYVLFYSTKKNSGNGSVTLVCVDKVYYIRKFNFSKDSLWLGADNEKYESMAFNGFSLGKVKLKAVKYN